MLNEQKHSIELEPKKIFKVVIDGEITSVLVGTGQLPYNFRTEEDELLFDEFVNSLVKKGYRKYDHQEQCD